MISKVKNLSSLPAVFAQYTFPPATTLQPGESCFVCLREFGEEPDDDGERPCRPLIIARCGHLIGSKCAQAFIKSDKTKQCPFCRASIDPTLDAIPMRLVWISALPWFSNRDRTTRQFAEKRVFPKTYVDHVYTRLVQRDLAFVEAQDLWYCHVGAGLFSHVQDAKYGLMLSAASWLLTLPWGKQYPELWLLSPALVNTELKWWCVAWLACAWVTLCSVARRHLRDQDADRKRLLLSRYLRAMYFLYARSAVVFLGYSGIIAVAVASWAVYCAVGALLIAHYMNGTWASTKNLRI